MISSVSRSNLYLSKHFEGVVAMANVKKLISIFASLLLAISIGTSGAANAASIDDPAAFWTGFAHGVALFLVDNGIPGTGEACDTGQAGVCSAGVIQLMKFVKET